MTALLSIFHVDNPVRQIVLDENKVYAVGREPSCTICIRDPELSRKHATLEFRDSRWTIRDNNSKNGISVAGKTNRESPLCHNTWIGLGTLALRFEELSPEQEKRQTQTEQRMRHQTLDGRRRMSAASDLGKVLENLLSSTLSISATERAFVMLTAEDGDLRVACSQNERGEAFDHREFVGSASAVQMAIGSRKPVVTCDAAAHHQLGSKASIAGSQTRALICLPLMLFGRLLGVIYADSRQPGKVFTELDVSLLSELAEHAALVVAAAKLDEELDQVDSEQDNPLVYTDRLRERVATLRHRIPDVGRRLPQSGTQSAAGVSWSWIQSQL